MKIKEKKNINKKSAAAQSERTKHIKRGYLCHIYVYELWRQKMNEITFKMCFNDRKEDYVRSSFVHQLAQPIQSTVAETRK